MRLRIKDTVAYVALKESKKALLRKIKLPTYLGRQYRCTVCGVRLRAFKPVFKSFLRKTREYGYIYPLASVETFNLSAYSCPACDASDRDRLYAMFFDDLFASLDKRKRCRLIDFAPSPAMRKRLKGYAFLDYRTADLNRRTVDEQIDITDMRSLPDDSVDMFLCSHILEHVPEDRKAMRELYRTLKPGGFAVVMVPIIHGVEETQEDPAISTPELRWKHYMQDDHIRQYGKRDFISRLETAGFRVEQLGSRHFGAERFRRAGIAADSVVYVARKTAANRLERGAVAGRP